MDKLIKLLAPFGVMGIVFIVALTGAMATGLAGAAAFTASMAALGPGGMIGGIATLGIVGLVSSLAVDYGLDAIVLAVINDQLKRKTKDEIWGVVESNRMISKALKLKVKDYLEQV